MYNDFCNESCMVWPVFKNLENFGGHWRFWKKSVVSHLRQVIVLITSVYKIQFT